MKTKTLSDKIHNSVPQYEDVEVGAIPAKDVKEFIKWCLDNNINQTGTTLVLPLNKFKEKLGDKLI